MLRKQMIERAIQLGCLAAALGNSAWAAAGRLSPQPTPQNADTNSSSDLGSREIKLRLEVGPDGRNLAFRIGPPWRGPKAPDVNDYFAMVVPMAPKAGDALIIPQSQTVTSIAWRPRTSPPELYLIAGRTGSVKRLFSVRVADTLQEHFATELPKETLGFAMHWNPSGTALAFDMSSIDGDRLALSEDAGRTIVVTDIRLAGHTMAWVDDDTLYVESLTNNDEQLLALEIEGSKATIVKTVAKAYNLHICGVVDGEVVYRVESFLFRGMEVIYSSEVPLEHALAGGSLIIVKTEDKLIVLDKDGNAVRERDMEKGARLAAFQPDTNAIYILTREKTRIERLSALTLAEREVAYELDAP